MCLARWRFSLEGRAGSCGGGGGVKVRAGVKRQVGAEGGGGERGGRWEE